MLAGVVAQGWGAPLAVGVGGAVTALFALAVLALRPVVRRLE
jgi:hypothetical protein